MLFSCKCDTYIYDEMESSKRNLGNWHLVVWAGHLIALSLLGGILANAGVPSDK